MDELKLKGKVESFEVRMHTRTGRKIVLLENAYGEFDEEGRLLQLQGYLIDITQRILAEEKLKHSENLFRTLTENTSAGIVIYNYEKFLYVNPATIHLLGYSEEEMKAMYFWDVVHPLDREMVKKRGQRRVRKEKVPGKYQFRMQTKTGETLWVDFTAGYLQFEGKDAGIGSIHDITKEKQAGEVIRMLSAAVEQSPLSVVITNLDAKIEYVNDSFTRTTGYTFQEIIGQNSRILQSGETPQSIYDDLWDTLLKGEVWRGEFINKRKNGENYYEYAVIAPIKDETGKVRRFIGMKEDVTRPA